MKALPLVSFIIPTLNSERLLPLCLKSILSQDYPRSKMELIMIDANSSDKTVQLARDAGVDSILSNPLKTGEAGKAIGVEASKGEVIAFIDSDNLLVSDQWLKKMLLPLEEPDVVSSECLYLAYRREDSFIDRYCALLGMNDPIHLFLGNYDRFSTLTGRWTELPLQGVEDRGDYLVVVLNGFRVPTMGANGYLIKREALQKVTFQPYYFDIDVVSQLASQGPIKVAMVKVAIVHLFSENTTAFLKKQKRRIEDYLYYQQQGLRHYDHLSYKWGYMKFIFSCLLFFPLFFQALKGYWKKRDMAWFFHPLACYLTLGVYGLATVKGLFKREAYKRGL